MRRRLIIAIGVVLLAISLGLAEMPVNRQNPASGSANGGVEAIASQRGRDGLARLSGVGNTVLDVLGLRTPGRRSKGELADSKGRQPRQQLAFVPHQRALAKVRPPKGSVHERVVAPAPNGASIQSLAEAIASPPPGADIVAELPPGNLPNFGGGPIGSGPIGPVFGGSPSIGGGGGVGPVTPPNNQPVISAVPEPSTWALMLMGFGVIGWSLRRVQRQQELPDGELADSKT